MWNYTSDKWILGEPKFEADLADPERRTGPWSGHRRFAYDLLRNGRPDVVVELGTHYGVSFFAFCQAVKDGAMHTRLHAVDTWKGDEHAGFYGEEVIEVVRRVIDCHYADLDIRLHRSLFDEALEDFPDQSIDFLHIDGFHSYEAVRHDFTSWQPKLADNAVVVFHDVDPASGYGSADHWRELREQHPSLTFPHSFGLGVLFPKGTAGHEALLTLPTDMLIAAYAERSRRELLSIQVQTLTTMVDARDEAIQAQARLIDERDDVIKAQGQLIDSLRQTISAVEQTVDARDEAIRSQTRMIDERDDVIRSQTRAIDERDGTIRSQAQMIEDLRAQVEADARLLDEREAQLAAISQELTGLAGDARGVADELAGAETALAEHDAMASGEPPRKASALRTFAGREIRRQQAIARAAAPYLPPRMVRVGVKAKRAVERNALFRRARGLPTVATPKRLPESFGSVFDEAFYRASYGSPLDISPMRHYLLNGWLRGFDPSPFFSVRWYLSAYPEVAASGQEPLCHYLETGYRAGHNPQPWFDGAWYARENPDVDLTRMSPLEHYVLEGLASGKSVSESHFRLLAGSRARALRAEPVPLTATVLAEGTSSGPIPFSSVPSTGFEVVTVDLWDTLLYRDRPADAAKVATARRMLIRLGPRADVGIWELYQHRVSAESALAAGADDEEYELANVLEHVLVDLGITPPEATDLADELADAEVDDEISATCPVPEVAAFVRQLLEQPSPPAIAVLSDFYMGKERLERLLNAHGLDFPVLSSCELGGSKRLATSFTIARDRLGRIHGRHLHIGDHPISDGRNAASSGATAVVLQRTHLPALPGPGELDATYYDGMLDQLGIDLNELGLALAPDEVEQPLERESFLAGVASAVLPTALVAGAIELAAEHGAERVFYLSREGAFLSQLHRLIGPSLAGASLSSPMHLEVSRRSTFGASITRVYEECTARLWRQYPSQSPRGFLVSLGLEPSTFESALARMGLPVDEAILDIKENLRFREFLELADVAAAMREAFTAQRDRLNAYLDARGFASETAIVVDVGWRGTIQDNLCYLRPDTTISGIYLGLFPYLHPQPLNARKRAVVFDGNYGEDYGYVSPPAAVESPWTNRVPTTVGYRWEQDGVAVAVGEIEEGRADTLVADYQRGVVAAAGMVANRLVANGATTSLLRRALQRQLQAFFEQPHPGVANIWFSSVHDDTFGAMNVTPFGKLRPPLRFAYQESSVRCSEEARASLWPAGYEQWRPVRALTAIRMLRSGPSTT